MTDSNHFHVTILGSGNPNVSLRRGHPAYVVTAGPHIILVDCGEGTSRQLLRAGMTPPTITMACFTHLHADHILGYPQFVLNRWQMSLQIPDIRPLRVYGVPGTRRMHALFFHELLKADVAQRLGYGYKPELYTDMTVDEWTPGVVFDKDGLRITAAEVVHPVYTLALRFDYAGRGLVMGADSSYCENLIELSRRADLLVADAVAIEPPASVTLSPAAREILAKIYQGHASPEEVGLMAHKAGVRSVVLSHIMGRFEFDSNDVIAQCRRQFSGEVRVAEDLEVYDV